MSRCTKEKPKLCSCCCPTTEKLPGPLNHRADTDTQSLSLLSPLHEALRHGYFEVGWVLFAYGERMEISPHSRWLFTMDTVPLRRLAIHCVQLVVRYYKLRASGSCALGSHRKTSPISAASTCDSPAEAKKC